LGDLPLAALEQRLSSEYSSPTHGLAAALSFIETNYQHDMTVDQITHAAGLSLSHFRTLFRKRFGQSPKRHVQIRRLKKAASILERTHHYLVQVALETGYGDQSAFSRAFQRQFGQSPTLWRRNQQRSEKLSYLS
jgi:transcriptional regulator GlxA family with amidase domain